jgi:hypothetical protein
MPKIKIKDLPKNQKISKSELKTVKGGIIVQYSAFGASTPLRTSYSWSRPILQPGGTIMI